MTNIYHNSHSYDLLLDKGRPKPRIPIRVINFETGQSIDINAIIDTGSDSCVFPAFISESIGYTLSEEDKKAKGLKGISGQEIETFVHGFKIQLLSNDRKNVLWSNHCVGCTVRTPNLTPILGTSYFLEYFKVSIDYKKNKIFIEW